jgi:hypothetical protein
MAVYSVFAPPLSQGEADAERFRFVRDGFSWGAFFLGPLWMIWRRLWLVLIGYVVIVAALTVALAKLPFGTAGLGIIPLLIALLLGLEGSSLRRWTLRRRGWSDLGIVVGEDIEAAERRFFEAWVAGAPDPRVPASASTPPPLPGPASAAYRMPSGSKPEVIGLFPDPGGTR